jgi:methanogenic corrinoid protein MtbC1
MTKSGQEVHEFRLALLTLNRDKARRALISARDDSDSLVHIEQIVIPALKEIGEMWERGVTALSQVYMAGRISEELIDELLPAGKGRSRPSPKMAIGVLEDYHALGKRLVYSTLRASGYTLLDYGHGLSVERMADLALEDGIEVLLVSTLMLRSALKVENLVSKLQAAGSTAKVVVGGAPFRYDAELWKETGAYAMGRDTAGAIEVVARLEGSTT